MSVFHFKRFSVDQAGCAMKINTDGVLLGTLAVKPHAKRVLDIGTGTGVIALMLAQRFPEALIDAVEIDEPAAQTAQNNFQNSAYSKRLQLYTQSFQSFFTDCPDEHFDLIVSNPPFYIHSLPSPGAAKAQAKHTDSTFLQQLINGCAAHLSEGGSLWLVLPVDTAALVKQIAAKSQLFLQQVVFLQSYPHSEPHRHILAFGLKQTEITEQRLIIYETPKVYSPGYQALLKDFLTIF